MDLTERKRLILAHQHLTAPTNRLTACGDVNGLQAQFLSHARHALALRTASALDGSWGDGLVKSWSIRGTMHLFPVSDLPLFLHRDRRHYLRDVDQFVDDPYAAAERKRLFACHILDLIDQGISAREDLRTACFQLGMTEREELSFFNSWGGLLRAMSEAGQICYQAREEKVFQRCPPFIPLDREAALLEQARRYFTHFGPATLRDAAYFFGMPQRQVKLWLEQLPVRSAVCDGQTCYWIDVGPSDVPPLPQCVLLAGFDQLLLGYEKRDGLFLPPEYLRDVFSRAGIVFPAVLLHGTVAGRWKCAGKRCQITPFRPFSPGEREAVQEQLFRYRPEVLELRWEE